MDIDKICSKLDISQEEIKILKKEKKKEDRFHLLLGIISSIISFIGGLTAGTTGFLVNDGYPYATTLIIPAAVTSRKKKIFNIYDHDGDRIHNGTTYTFCFRDDSGIRSV